jgi:hypothetical protein
MKTITATELRSNIYNILDEILATGIPVEINKGGKRLKVIAVDQPNKLDNLIARPEAITGDPADIVEISWEKEINLDLP